MRPDSIYIHHQVVSTKCKSRLLLHQATLIIASLSSTLGTFYKPEARPPCSYMRQDRRVAAAAPAIPFGVRFLCLLLAAVASSSGT